MNIGRRDVMKRVSLLSGLLLLKQADSFAGPLEHISKSLPELTNDEWAQIRTLFHLKPNLINLHNGVSPTLKSVLSRAAELTAEAQAYPMDGAGALYMKLDELKVRVAGMVNTKVSEIAFTASTTEGANIIIQGLPLTAQDEILYTNQEYPSLVEAISLKSLRCGVQVRKVTLDFNPESAEAHVARIEESFSSRTKLLVISEVSCRNGEIYPIKEIVARAHAHGIEVLVDGAHAFGHIDLDIKDLDCDYYTTCFHKWMAGPMGSGFLFCKQEKIAAIYPLCGSDVDPKSGDILKFENFYSYGVSVKVATLLALDVHEGIGIQKKQARLSELRTLWMDQLSSNRKVTFTTPRDPSRAAGMGSFRLEGYDGHSIVKEIKAKHSLALGSNGPTGSSQIRVTPHIYTSTEEITLMTSIINNL